MGRNNTFDGNPVSRGNCYGSSVPLNFRYPGDGPPSPPLLRGMEAP
jgi:hypothetical protein